MDLLFYIVLSAALVAGIITRLKWASAGVRAGRLRRHDLTNFSPLSGFRTGESGAYGVEGGRMIAAISIGIIIVAVIIAALAIIYFILKGTPQ